MPLNTDSDAHPSVVLYRSIRSQDGAQDTAARYLAATLDGEYRGQDVVIEGEVRVTVTLRERATGRMLGQAEHSISLPVTAEHLPAADTDVLEVSPGTGDKYPEAVVG